MAGNRWQAGLYGNYTDARDEQVRLIVDGIIAEHNCSPSEAIKRAILDRAIANGSGPEPIRDLCAIAPEVDLTGVHMRLDMLAEQVAQLAAAIGRLQVTPRETVTQTVVDGITGEQREIEAEVVPIDPNDNTPFIRGARNMARPGMRLQD